jgi:DNA-binding Lrp family transcriptional regulator
MDEHDRSIINIIQSDFPISPRPYAEVGKRLNLSEEDVLNRVRALKEEGIIRRIGASFNSRKLDFTSTLCAARVPEEKVEAFVETVNRFSGVTHNYLRSNPYNVWFTFIAETMNEIEQALDSIRKETGVEDIRNLPAVRTFKIKVDFAV